MITSPRPCPEEFLLDYAAGASSPCMSLLVATHLALSPAGRELHALLEAVGGAMLESLRGERVEEVSAASVLRAADRSAEAAPQSAMADDRARLAPAGVAAQVGFRLPAPLQGYAGELAAPGSWQRLGPRAKAVRLSVSSPQEVAHLLWARAGTRIAEHEHRGREIALVLKGAFWDGGDCFGRGEIAVHGGGDRHAPLIDPAEDCVCLAVTDPGAIHFTGPFGWLLDRWFRL
jgi:putative transcriptional regulator